MPVELTIVESVTALETTVVEVILESASTPGPAGPGVPVGGTDGQVLTKTSATDYATAWEDAAGGGGGAPTDADYLVGTANAALSAEIVVGATPGGELGGTWAAPTVDATHSGSTHAAVQAAAEATAAAALSAHLTDAVDAHDASAISSVAAGNLAATDVQTALNELDTEKAATSHAHAGEDITSGTVADARIAATIARDSEVSAGDAVVQANLDAHIADAIDAHDASAISILDTAADFTATDVEGALAELQSDHEADATALSDHIADPTAAHAGSAISVDSTTLSGTGTTVQASLEELDNLLDDHSARHEDGGADEISLTGLSGTPADLTTHLNDAADAHDASAISVLDTAGDYTATDVEGVLAEIAFSGVKAHRTTTQSIASGSFPGTAISFDAEDFDTDGYHEGATNPTRITIPAGKGGKYLIGGNFDWATGTTGTRAGYIRVDGTTIVAASRGSAAGDNVAPNPMTLIDLAAGQYIEFLAYHTQGANLNVNTSDTSPKFWATRMP